jgi:hypothetical protein
MSKQMLVSRKVFATIQFFLFSIVSVFAQQEMTLPALTWIPQAGYTDLTIQPDQYKTSIGLPLLSSVQFYHYNSAFNFNSLVKDNVIDPNNVIPKLKKLNQIYSGGSFDLFSMRFKSEKTYYQISLRDVWSERFVYTADLANLVWNGNASYAGKTADLNDVRVAANYYRELALSANKSINDKLIVGVRGKFLMGLTNVTTKESKNTLYTDPNGASINGHSEFTLLTSGLLNADEIKVGDFLGFQNLGGALDIGARYKVTEKLSIACNVTNIGFINWKKDVKNYRVDGDYTYTGYIMRDSSDVTNADWENVTDTLIAVFKPTENSKAYKSWLTPSIYFNGNYLLTENLTLYSAIAIDVYHSVRPTLTVGGTQTVGKTIQATINYTITSNSYFNLGGGFAVRGGPVQLYLACDNIIAVFDPYAVKYFNARLGINILLGKVDTSN